MPDVAKSVSFVVKKQNKHSDMKNTVYYSHSFFNNVGSSVIFPIMVKHGLISCIQLLMS